MPGEFPPSVDQDETLTHDADYFLATFGLGPEETQREVTSGMYTGTVAAMLTDEKCPVGGVVASAFKEGGLEAVDAKLQSLAAFAPDFALPISESTRAYHAGTIQRDELFAKPHSEPQTERPDFLAKRP